MNHHGRLITFEKKQEESIECFHFFWQINSKNVYVLMQDKKKTYTEQACYLKPDNSDI